MLYGAIYYFIDLQDPNRKVDDKVWVKDAFDISNKIFDNIYATKEDAERDRLCMVLGI